VTRFWTSDPRRSVQSAQSVFHSLQLSEALPQIPGRDCIGPALTGIAGDGRAAITKRSRRAWLKLPKLPNDDCNLAYREETLSPDEHAWKDLN
jgi:hypothetical protein